MNIHVSQRADEPTELLIMTVQLRLFPRTYSLIHHSHTLTTHVIIQPFSHAYPHGGH